MTRWGGGVGGGGGRGSYYGTPIRINDLNVRPFRLGARGTAGTGPSLNEAFCWCPSTNLGTVRGHAYGH